MTKKFTKQQTDKIYADADTMLAKMYPAPFEKSAQNTDSETWRMSAWKPIETAPKDGTIIWLTDKYLRSCAVMSFDKSKKLWVGRAFGILGSLKTYWDESCVPIAKWKHYE